MSELLELITVKAVEDGGRWKLEIRALPFGGPHGGRDSHGEYFSDRTEIHADKFAPPPLVYYHGFGAGSRKVYIGKSVTQFEKRSDGYWITGELDPRIPEAALVWEAAKRGEAAVSSGSAPHLVVYGRGGEILEWPPVEISLWEPDAKKSKPANAYAVAIPATKALYEQAGLEFPSEFDQDTDELQDEAIGEQQEPASVTSGEVVKSNDRGDKMADEIKGLTAEDARQIAEAAVKADREAREAEAKAKADEDARIAEAVKAEREKWDAEAAKDRRLPGGEGGAPYVTKFGGLARYDNLSIEENALVVSILNGNHNDVPVKRASPNAIKALAVKVAEDKSEVGSVGRYAMKMAGVPSVKADEVMQQDLTGFGDEWVGISYGAVAWQKIRAGTFVLGKLPQREVPIGYESDIVPLESTDPTFYKVAEVTDLNGTTGRPNATVTSSRVATDKKQVTLSKMGARVPFSGEFNEDSLVPAVPQINQQLMAGFSEQFEYAIVDGDTETGASTNINDIAGTPAATDLFLLFNGFRKLALVTNTANSRSGGTVDTEDVLETVKLMGAAGINALDITKVSIIPDLNVYWKMLTLAELKTRDVNGNPTIENGRLTRVYGYDIEASAFMHYLSSVRKANTAGKVDQDTVANNTTGSMLAVRWDQWLLYWKRRLTAETWRLPQADYSEIVMIARAGLVNRDNEASAITYNMTV